jgi:hypothetical protein
LPKFSIITPTIGRESLVRACRSVDAQTFTDWEHFVMVDSEFRTVPEALLNPRRIVKRCRTFHGNWGNTCRHLIWTRLHGEYVYALDDDNYLADTDVLKDLASVTEPWAIFPILRYGEPFFHDPPGLGRTDTGSFIVRRELGPWPDSPRYDADGVFVEHLRAHHRYASLGGLRPLMVMEKSGHGV